MADIEDSPAVVACTADETGHVTLEADREYAIVHVGKDAAGNDATEPIVLSKAVTDIGVAGENDYSAGADKFILTNGAVVVWGPGETDLYYEALNSDNPVMSIKPGPKLAGNW